MSPRRSSRARVAQPTANPSEQSSVSSSMASSRLDRNTRSNPRQEHNSRSTTTPQSTSSDEEMEGRSELETRQTRRKKREQDIQYDRNAKVDEEVLEDEEGEEEEITRCICRKQEYPGAPIPMGESGRTQQAKDSQSISLDLDNLPEDAGSLFIQCDSCKVWQHGGCVGIMDEAMSPDNYYCEECRKDLHRVMVGAKGQRYSRYLPVYEALNPKPVNTPTASKDSNSRSSKESDSKAPGSNARASTSKRRLTMNSRAALEEEEAIRKAIEESKTDGTGASSSNGNRKGKRARDDGEESRYDLKRRKTGSDSESQSNVNTTSVAADSDNETPLSKGKLTNKRGRQATTSGQSQREREMREREKEKEREREREREEVAGKRKGRADRRRLEDEMEPPEDITRSGKTASMVNTLSKIAKTQNAVASAAALGAAGQRKNGRPTTRRGRVGRNQYTKDMLDKESPLQSNSRDSDDAANLASDGHGGGHVNNVNKPSKPKHMNPNRTSMNDLRKRAAGILEYISRTKSDLDGETTPPASSNGASNTPTSLRSGLTRIGPSGGGGGGTVAPASKLNNELGEGSWSATSAVIDESAEQREKDRVSELATSEIDEAGFRKLNSTQMMEVLQREILLWQTNHGKFGEKATA